MTDQKTPEQIEAEKAQAKAAAAQAKAEAKEKAEAAKKEAAEKKKAAADEAKQKREAAKAEQQKAADEAKAKKAEERAKAAEEKAKNAAVKKEKVVLVSQMGITRPKADTSTGKVWAIADELSGKLQKPVSISTLAPACAAAGLNDATTRTQYARWKQFHSVFGPVAKETDEQLVAAGLKTATPASTPEAAAA